jgi:hypothetical protein
LLNFFLMPLMPVAACIGRHLRNIPSYGAYMDNASEGVCDFVLRNDFCDTCDSFAGGL